MSAPNTYTKINPTRVCAAEAEASRLCMEQVDKGPISSCVLTGFVQGGYVKTKCTPQFQNYKDCKDQVFVCPDEFCSCLTLLPRRISARSKRGGRPSPNYIDAPCGCFSAAQRYVYRR
jgi:hypothetical protein